MANGQDLEPLSVVTSARIIDPLKDTWIYRATVITLGLALLISLIGSIVLSAIYGKDAIPQVLVALGSAAVGALAGLLTPGQTRNG